MRRVLKNARGMNALNPCIAAFCYCTSCIPDCTFSARYLPSPGSGNGSHTQDVISGGSGARADTACSAAVQGRNWMLVPYNYGIKAFNSDFRVSHGQISSSVWIPPGSQNPASRILMGSRHSKLSRILKSLLWKVASQNFRIWSYIAFATRSGLRFFFSKYNYKVQLFTNLYENCPTL
jgi:hypothetical protein